MVDVMGSNGQDTYENFFFVVDLHAITVPQDPKQLKTGVVNAVATYLAAGIDPEKSKIFVQVWCNFFNFGWRRASVPLSLCRSPHSAGLIVRFKAFENSLLSPGNTYTIAWSHFEPMPSRGSLPRRLSQSSIFV